MQTKSTLYTALATALFFSISNAQTVSTIAGSGVAGNADGQSTSASFSYPYGIAITPANAIYIADGDNNRLRKIASTGNVSTLAGSSLGYADGFADAAKFSQPFGVAINSVGTIYLADSNNHRIRKITPAGIVTTFAGGAEGYADGIGTAAQFSHPTGVTVDGAGNVIVSDFGNNRIRKITPNGVVTTIAGGSIEGSLDGDATSAQFSLPTSTVVDAEGNIFVSDSGNNRIRKISTSGQVTTFAGSDAGYADGTGTAAKFYFQHGLAIDLGGNILVADVNNHRIRKITPSGVVTTLAGGDEGFADGPLASAKFQNPFHVAVDANGNIFVSDTGNNRIRKISGVLSTPGIADAFALKIFPNPTQSIVYIETPDTTGATATIYDQNGRLLLEKKMGANETAVDLSGFEGGVYFVKVNSGKDVVVRQVLKR